MVSLHLRAAQAFLGFILLLVACTLIVVLVPSPTFEFSEFTTTSSPNPQPNPNDAHEEFDPLSQPARPIRYDLTIIPDISTLSFTGNITITFTSTIPVSTVWLHASSDIVFDPIPYTITRYPPTSDVQIDFPTNVSGNFTLQLTYSSPLSTDNLGFYATVDTISGAAGAATQFEPTHARRAFPCHDSPGARAVFSFALSCEPSFLAISNTPAKRIETIGSRRLHHFHETPPMPPYLLAFAVGKWDLISSFTARAVPVDVYTPHGQTDYGEFALRLAVDSIEFFEYYFGVNFPLPRLQLASIPDFAAGAMENWGFVTFRDSALLAKIGVSSPAALARVAEVVVHENAHMWCGDLVSPRTWQHLWLNEAFATLMPYICLPNIAPDYTCLTDFSRLEIQEAIAFDFSTFTHAITLEGSQAMFDSITYSKGATVLGMLVSLIDVDIFRSAMSDYFKEYQYKAMTSGEFLGSLDRSIGVNISEFMQPWLTQEGFPTIQVSRTVNGYHLKQTRLRRSGEETDMIWPIPLNLSTGEVILFSEQEMEYETDEFVTFNDGRLAMAIVEYDSDLLVEVIARWDELTMDTRWMLFEDLWELMLAGKVGPSSLWDALKWIDTEVDLDVVEAAVLRGVAFYRLFPRLNLRLSEIFRPFLLWATEDSLFESRLRVELLSALIEMDDQETVNSLRDISIDDAAEELLPLVMQLRGRTDFAFVVAEYKNAVTPQRRNAALSAIGATRTNATEALAMLLDGVKTHEITTLLAALAANPNAKGLIVNWFKTNVDILFERFTTTSQMRTIVETVISTCGSTTELDELVDFVTGGQWEPLAAAVGRQHELEAAKLRVKAIEWEE